MTSAQILGEMKKKVSEIGWDSLINVCHQIHRDVGEISFKESFRVYTCYYRRSVISSFDCIKKYGFNSAQQIVASQECVPLNVPGEGSCLSGMSQTMLNFMKDVSSNQLCTQHII